MNQVSVAPDSHHALQEHSNVSRKFGFWLFLSSELLIFAGLIFSFAITRLGVFTQGMEHVEKVHWPEFNTISLALVSVNTFVLLFSSVAVVAGINAIRDNNDKKGLVRWLAVVALMGLVFLGGQAYEYNGLINGEGQGMSTAFGGPFFTLTGLHGLHVAVGVIWCLITLAQAARGTYSSKSYTSVEVFGLYWHFVDLVWVIIFTIVYLISDKA